jgi:hypothetical protein
MNRALRMRGTLFLLLLLLLLFLLVLISFVNSSKRRLPRTHTPQLTIPITRQIPRMRIVPMRIRRGGLVSPHRLACLGSRRLRHRRGGGGGGLCCLCFEIGDVERGGADAEFFHEWGWGGYYAAWGFGWGGDRRGGSATADAVVLFQVDVEGLHEDVHPRLGEETPFVCGTGVLRRVQQVMVCFSRWDLSLN